MKMPTTYQGRCTVKIPQLSIKVGGLLATNAMPFLVRAKWSFEPFLAPLEDDPGAPEWFAFDGLYALDPVLFFAEGNVVLTIGSAADLLMLLDKSQLEVVEK